MIEKPTLERRERIGAYGEIVSELTPESEQIWADYLRRERLARIALYRTEHELDKEAMELRSTNSTNGDSNDKEAET